MNQGALVLLTMVWVTASQPIYAQGQPELQQDSLQFLRPKKSLPDMGISENYYPPAIFDRNKMQAYLERKKIEGEELRKWAGQINELKTKANTITTDKLEAEKQLSTEKTPLNKMSSLGRRYDFFSYSPYLSVTSAEDRLYLIKFLGLNLPDTTTNTNLSKAIVNEYNMVETFLDSYSPSFHAKFKDLEKEEDAGELQKQEIVLSALASSLAELRDNTTRTQLPDLFSENHKCVRNMVLELSKNRKPIPLARIKSRLQDFAKNAILLK